MSDQLGGRRVLVTGGSGFIGRHVVAELAAAGADVRVVDLAPHPDPEIEVVQGDLADRSVREAALKGGPDSIVHLAAVTSVLRSLEHPELTYRTNVAATAGLLEESRAAGCETLVFASTNAVTGPMDGPAISESATLRPLTPYGSTKAAAEMLMSAYTASYGLRCACLRLTNVYGPGMQAKDSIVARLMRAIRCDRTFEVYGDGRQLRDYLHVSDVVAAVRLALVREDWHGPMVLGSGASLSVLEVVDAVRHVSGAELQVRHGPAKPGEMPAVVVDPGRAHAAGWSPRHSLDEGLPGVWEEWSRAEIDGAPPWLPAGRRPVRGPA
ncbi:MAG: NAD-dependent epimerase/dehydratase family protein [Solirubrobacteraceae bacterium]